MLKFNEQELQWIKEQLDYVFNIYENGTKEELKEWIHLNSGESLDTVLLFTTENYQLFQHINSDKYYNNKMVNWLWDNHLWVWRESDFTTAEEVREYIDDEIYCQLFQKIYEYFVSLDEQKEEVEEN